VTRDRATVGSVALALALALALTLGWADAPRAGAATDQSPATDATPVVARAVAAAVGPMNTSERRCVTRALAAQPRLTGRIVKARVLERMASADQITAAKLAFGCAPDTLGTVFLGDIAANGVTVAPDEARCMATGMSTLSDAVWLEILAARGGTFDNLDATSRQQTLAMVVGCMPTTLGKIMAKGITASLGTSTGVTLSEADDRCLGAGVVAAFGVDGLEALAGQGTATPAQSATAVRVLVTCSPDLVKALFRSSFAKNGIPATSAACLADRVVGDPALLDAVITAGATGAGAPPGLTQAVAACR